MRRKIKFLLLAAGLCLAVAGCGKKTEGPTEATLTATTLDKLQPGNFYVKSGDAYYPLVAEDANFDASKAAKSTDGTEQGMTNPSENRLVDFVYKDSAIPTLYKNDQLIYVATDSLSTFQWERFKDYGYSIGASGLVLNDAGKVSTGKATRFAAGSTLSAAMTESQLDVSQGLLIDNINGTPLTEKFLNDAGVITGMSKDANAQIQSYVGTQPVTITATADTRYFKSFEVFQTESYSLSTDGYAIINVPDYFKSGYYLINNVGFVKFLNVDKGVDESAVSLDTPYFYTGEDGKTLTFYEWQEAQGIDTSEMNGAQAAGTGTSSIKAEDYPDRTAFAIDNTQQKLNVSVTYRYNSDVDQKIASENGKFPKAMILDPTGNVTVMKEDKSQSGSTSGSEGDIYLSAQIDNAVAGEWNILFSNFENTTKHTAFELVSGNATTYMHNGSSGSINIYYTASDAPHDIVITWEKKDRAVSDIKITAPDGTEYSKEKTPGNIMADEYGRFIIKLPNLLNGTYRFNITGDNLGRVWINDEESVGLNETSQPAAETQAETAAPDTTAAEIAAPETMASE